MADESSGNVVRRFTQDEVARIIRLASDLQERHGGLLPSRGGVTLNEIEQIAMEVGIAPEWIREAVTGAQPPSTPARTQPPGTNPIGRRRSRLYGSPRQFRCEASLDRGVITGAGLTTLPPVIHDVMESHGESRVTEQRLEWVHDSSGGTVQVTVSRDQGTTRIVAEADRAPQARRNLISGTLAGTFVMGLLGLATEDPAGFMFFATTGAAAGLVVGRAWWNRQASKWRRRMSSLIQRLSESVSARFAPTAFAERGAFRDATDVDHAEPTWRSPSER
ncbi:MAG: hypothetical protein ACREL7_13305 [Longimicrobiales bacterium]